MKENDQELIEYLRELESKPVVEKELIIENDTVVWLALMKYGALIKIKEDSPEYTQSQRVTSISRPEGKLEIGLCIGRHKLSWKGYIFHVVVTKVSGSESGESATIYLKTPETCQAFQDFIRIARERSRKKGTNDLDKLVVKIWSGSWKKISAHPKRPANSFVTADDTVKNLIGDMKNFLDSEDEYTLYGLSYKRNYLIIGDPGSGKSSLVSIVASELDLDICYLTITSDMNEKSMSAAVSSITENSILVIEDVDVLSQNAASGNQHAKVAQTVLTNVLDGTLHKRGLITILTSAVPDALEDVLVRHGRVDYTTTLQKLNKKQVELLTKRTFKSREGYKKLSSEIWSTINGLGDLTSTHITQWLFRHRNLDPSDINQDILQELQIGTDEKHMAERNRNNYIHNYM
jgi:hypothetical protein